MKSLSTNIWYLLLSYLNNWSYLLNHCTYLKLKAYLTIKRGNSFPPVNISKNSLLLKNVVGLHLHYLFALALYLNDSIGNILKFTKKAFLKPVFYSCTVELANSSRSKSLKYTSTDHQCKKVSEHKPASVQKAYNCDSVFTIPKLINSGS